MGRPAISMTERKRSASLMRARGQREGLRSVGLEGFAGGSRPWRVSHTGGGISRKSWLEAECVFSCTIACVALINRG